MPNPHDHTPPGHIWPAQPIPGPINPINPFPGGDIQSPAQSTQTPSTSPATALTLNDGLVSVIVSQQQTIQTLLQHIMISADNVRTLVAAVTSLIQAEANDQAALAAAKQALTDLQANVAELNDPALAQSVADAIAAASAATPAPAPPAEPPPASPAP